MFNIKEYDDLLLSEIGRRATMLQKCNEDKKLQLCLIEQCKEDVLFYFRNFAWTKKNEIFIWSNLPYAIPFLPFEYQETLITDIWNAIIGKYSIFFEKSRQIWMTWIILEIFKYIMLFHWKSAHIISRTSDEVDSKWDVNSCFWRLRFSLELTPRFLLPEWFDKKEWWRNNKYMNICRSDMPSAITWESANPNAARWWTYDVIFLDEMAFMQDAKAINRSASQATSCRLINSTPNWEYNEYFEMKRLVNEGKMEWHRLHWSIHPFYTKKWYEWKIDWLTDEQIQQELEMNYNLSIEGRVYKMFEVKPIWVIDIWIQYDYNYLLPLYVSIDNSHWGQDPHAVIVSQVDQHWNINIIDCVQMQCSVTDMAHFLAKNPIHKMNNYEMEFFDRYNTYKTPIFIADPYDTKATMNDTTIYNEYRKVGIHLNTPIIERWLHWNLVEQIRITTNLVNRMKVHERCKQDFVSAIQNARYPSRKDWHNATSELKKPVHDQTSHFRTSLEYLSMWIYQQENTWRSTNWTIAPKIKKKVMVWDPITWQNKEIWIEN